MGPWAAVCQLLLQNIKHVRDIVPHVIIHSASTTNSGWVPESAPSWGQLWVHDEDKNTPGYSPRITCFLMGETNNQSISPIYDDKMSLYLPTSGHLTGTHSSDASDNRGGVTGKTCCFQLLHLNIISSVPLILISSSYFARPQGQSTCLSPQFLSVIASSHCHVHS